MGWKYAAERDSTLPPLQAAFMRHFQSSADTHLVFGEVTKRLSAAAVRAKDRRRARKRARLREASAPPGAAGGAPAPPPSFEEALASRGLRLAGIMLRFSQVRPVAAQFVIVERHRTPSRWHGIWCAHDRVVVDHCPRSCCARASTRRCKRSWQCSAAPRSRTTSYWRRCHCCRRSRGARTRSCFRC